MVLIILTIGLSLFYRDKYFECGLFNICKIIYRFVCKLKNDKNMSCQNVLGRKKKKVLRTQKHDLNN